MGGDGWPGGDLRVTAVSVATGERSVWDAGSGVPLGRAVAGSCSVPGLFPPVQVGPERFVDGGVWSGSNADVLLGRGVDVAVFVGPLVGETGVGRVSARALEREQAELAAAGIPLHSVVPGAAFAALGANLMDSSMRAEAVDVGRAEGAQAAADLAPLVLA
ncbi:MAG: patatin-like phospholipase family protein [Acidimicrobiia bacterium]|nr:patatin-like phospholipase family protein [Acidimicrobiia bacterium]